MNFETSYGKFTVKLNLFQKDDFSPRSRFTSMPVVAVTQEICVRKSELKSFFMKGRMEKLSEMCFKNSSMLQCFKNCIVII